MLSIIIPTHNRAHSLLQTIESILAVRAETTLEIVVVDNNSTDETPQELAKYANRYPNLFQCAVELRTAFSAARKTGCARARGEFLLYLDDDVLLVPGSLERIGQVFSARPDVGVIAGRIMPHYLRQPPPWTLQCQESFNGWSLFEPFANGAAANKEVSWAAGPMMAVRRAAYDRAGGFPPDTIGLETNQGKRTFKKLYVGPGDYGLCERIRAAGYKAYFTPDIACYHVIPPIRFTVKFWRSRLTGEGHHSAVSNREFFNLSAPALFLKRKQAYAQYLFNRQALAEKITQELPGRISRRYQGALFSNLARIVKLLVKPGSSYAPFCSLKSALAGKLVDLKEQVLRRSFEGMYPEELWVCFAKAYLETDHFLGKHPSLGSFLWKIASDGVEDSEFDHVMSCLPAEYRKLFVEEGVILNDVPLSAADFDARTRLHSELELGSRRSEKTIQHVSEFYQDTSPEVDLASAFLGYESLEKVAKVFDGVVQHQPKHADLLLWAACLHNECGDRERAGSCFASALECEPENQDAVSLASYQESAR